MRDSPATVLVADPDARDRQCLRDYLEQQDFVVREVSDGRQLLADIELQVPHLIVLDLALPSVGGADLCRRIKRYGDVPIVVLTSLEDENTKVAALEHYAEDYILKPATYPEVAARIRRVLRRTWLSCSTAGYTVLVDDRLTLNFLHREARTPSGVSRLTPMETRLLELLVRNAGHVLPTELLLERLWGDACNSAANLWEYVRRVRHKIGDDAASPRYIRNEPGVGYRFCGAVPGST